LILRCHGKIEPHLESQEKARRDDRGVNPKSDYESIAQRIPSRQYKSSFHEVLKRAVLITDNLGIIHAKSFTYVLSSSVVTPRPKFS